MSADRGRLLGILEAVSRVEKHSAKGRGLGEQDELKRAWILQRLQILGEATGRLCPDFQDRHPGLPWQAIVGPRNILPQHYFDAAMGFALAAVNKDLPLQTSMKRRWIG